MRQQRRSSRQRFTVWLYNRIHRKTTVKQISSLACRSFFFVFSSLLCSSHGLRQKCVKFAYHALSRTDTLDFPTFVRAGSDSQRCKLRGQIITTKFVCELSGGILANVPNRPSAWPSRPPATAWPRPMASLLPKPKRFSPLTRCARSLAPSAPPDVWASPGALAYGRVAAAGSRPPARIPPAPASSSGTPRGRRAW
jgi:hypothetical protein